MLVFRIGIGAKRTGVNVGEADEPALIETLVALKGKYVECLGFIIASVADHCGREYADGIKRHSITKAPTTAKRDVVINHKGYSLKSSRARPPAIVNHTTREKWVRICQKVGTQIDMLDEMVLEYWDLRISYKIGEDIQTSSPYCPFGNTEPRRQYLKALFNYFLFDGSGSEDSRYPADYILEFSQPTDPTTWKILTKETAFEAMWPHMIFSIRSKKGMPTNYPNINPSKKKQMEPWVRHFGGDYRGSLHVRAGK